MRVSTRGLALIQEFEGFRSRAYQDVVGVWTIGYGFTEGVKPGDVITKAQALARLSRELRKYESAVRLACTIEPTQNQFDAIVSFCWNVGIDGMRRSSVIKAHNRGDLQAAARAFGLWNKAGGKVWPGLVRRRAAEAALYLEPEADAAAEPAEMPQAVDAESRLTQSGINRASVVAGGTAAVATVAEVTRTVADVKASVDGLGNWVVPLLLVVVVGLCGYIVWQRVLQRKGGWA